MPRTTSDLGSVPQFKVGSFTRDTSAASGTQAITGVGFQPKAVYFQGTQETTDEMSTGIDTITTQFTTYSYDGTTADTWSDSNTYSLLLWESTGNWYGGQISAVGSDGFTITWTKTGSPTGTYTVGYLAFG